MRYAATVGERARIGHALPTKLAIADRRIALVTTELELEHSAALVVGARPLVDLLVAAFEAVWEHSASASACGRRRLPGPVGPRKYWDTGVQVHTLGGHRE